MAHMNGLERVVGERLTLMERLRRIDRNFARCQLFNKIRGDEKHIFVQSAPQTTTIRFGEQEEEGGGSASVPTSTMLFCQITGTTETGIVDANGNAVQWLYTISQVVKTATAYGSAKWAVPDEDGYVGNARNMCEIGNTGAGIQDCGINPDGELVVDRGIMMIPIQGTLPFFFITTTAGDLEAWFDRVNSFDGTCAE